MKIAFPCSTMMRRRLLLVQQLLLLLLSLLSSCHAKDLPADLQAKLKAGKRLTRTERKQVQEAEKARYIQLRKDGVDEVSHTEEAAALRNYRLRNKKRTGLLRKRVSTLADILFPGVAPNDYKEMEPLWIYADLVESRRTPIPYEFYDLPMCGVPMDDGRTALHKRKNLGSRLQGHDPKPAPFSKIKVKQDLGCTPLCKVDLSPKQLRWMVRLVERQYRVQLNLDQLPVLMRSKELNYAVRGYPLGFQAPESFESLKKGEFYIFNHLKFVISYNQKESATGGVRITGFDVHPISVDHQIPDGTRVDESSHLPTCNGEEVDNDPSNYLALRLKGPAPLSIVYSYEVVWEASPLAWADRWDVYLVGAPDDDLHYFSIVNSLMIVLFLTGAISTIMIRTLRKDIAFYNEMDALDDSEETGWKLVHGDVFRPPLGSGMALSVCVGTGCQIGVAFALSMLAAVLNLLNPLQKGQTLTALLVLYVMCGSVAGYVSARIYKYTEEKDWKLNVILTAAGLPGAFGLVFAILNLFLAFAGAATAVSFVTIVILFLLWVCVSAPLVFVGAFFGLKADRIEVPCKTKQIARIVPATPWHVQLPYTVAMGGILPFGSVCIELAFIMSALWLHQIYYVMGFLFAVAIILALTCAQVSIVLTYLQLCAEDHRWWWSSFWNCASAGGYLFLYSLWFLTSRLDMVGVLPVVVYLTYMAMISISFGLFCGSIGFLSSFWFTRTIYGAVKVE